MFSPTKSGMTVGANVDGAAAASVIIYSNNNGKSERIDNIPSLGNDTGLPFPQILGEDAKFFFGIGGMQSIIAYRNLLASGGFANNPAGASQSQGGNRRPTCWIASNWNKHPRKRRCRHLVTEGTQLHIC